MATLAQTIAQADEQNSNHDSRLLLNDLQAAEQEYEVVTINLDDAMVHVVCGQDDLEQVIVVRPFGAGDHTIVTHATQDEHLTLWEFGEFVYANM